MQQLSPNPQRQKAEAFLRGLPKGIRAVGLLATVLGLFFMMRFLVSAYAGKLTFAKAILYGLLVFGLLLMNGFSLVRRSRSGYVIVAVVACLPVLGLLAQSLHLFSLLITGEWANDKIGVVGCALSAGQLIVTGFLLGFLLSNQVRRHVWRNTDASWVENFTRNLPLK